MAQQTNIFRVFVNFTISDMKEVELILQGDVFPKLERFLEGKMN